MSVVFEKIAQGPGEIGPSPGFQLHAGESAFARLNANIGGGANQFDNVDGSGNPTLLVDVLIEESEDGIEYMPIGPPSKFSGTARTRDNKLPGTTINNTTNGDRFYRATMTLNKNLPIGINWETV